MCRSDSGADTRDSESAVPASLADERKKRERRRRMQRKGRKKLKKKKRKVEKRARGKPSFVHYLFNSLDSNFSPIVGVSIIVVTVINHSGSVGDFLFIKAACQEGPMN